MQRFSGGYGSGQKGIRGVGPVLSEVVPGAAVAGVLGVFSTALLAFAGVALFVGVFIIVNTFSITVAQRVREFALLRAIGAGRRQIMTSALVEAGVLGLVGGLVGLALGVLLASGVAVAAWARVCTRRALPRRRRRP